MHDLPSNSTAGNSATALADLPAPDGIAAAHSQRLSELLRDQIAAAGGSISFARYMSTALYEPGLGYYMAGAAKFGAQGDFITAPEVTPLYGWAMANQIREVLDNTDGEILELGAGSGKLALSILQALQNRPGTRYTILEPSAELALRQRRLLAEHLSDQQLGSVQWLETLPTQFHGVIVANEVMDALPVERFRVGPVLESLCVSTSLESVYLPADERLSSAVAAIESDIGYNLPAGYESEVCLVLRAWVQSLAACLQQGVILLSDYGYPRREYYLEERSRGTLACYYQHRMHDNPYHLPGLQDITAHVDFTSVAEAAVAADVDLSGYASQSAFLLDNDLLVLAEEHSAQLTGEAARIAMMRAVKTLTLPGEMGERFQVMALGKRYDAPLRGFRTQDYSYRL